ncbi:DedA family protein [Peribacillus loiseleuriae]|uniref:VTT domain-containing protein n=1 Tax=Peribacillus loiseleuriae TaxID=1679170 RepID=A0A0K9GUG9_9BACI|nr:DedA family protein [Peribacillus loiseleuriae]KMY50286.1 hypothetical protein AC625_12910 [Peribacillus loiseleuriae]
MQAIKSLIDFILHIDTHLLALVSQYGTLTYFILFLIIFGETGLVITPFLPGDSLLFVAGSIAAQGSLNIWILLIILFIGAILGDTVNFWIGHYIGPKVFENDRFKLINKKYLLKAQDFYERKGPIVIVLARFIPIVRTFAPFVAGVSKMNFRKFVIYNIVGGGLWIFLMTLAGFFFGSIPIIKENFSLVTIAIIIISLIPVAKSVIQMKFKKTS